MAGAVGNKFYDDLLKAMLAGGSAPSGYHLHLFTNSGMTITKSTVPGDFTEASGSGYAAKSIAANAFTVTLVGSVEEATLATLTFSFTGAITIQGYYVTDSGDSKFYWGETAGPFTFPAGGGSLGVSLELDGP